MRMLALLRKELADERQNLALFVPTLIVGFVAVLLPVLVAVIIPYVAGERLSDSSDFEVAIDRAQVSPEVWEKTMRKDLIPMLREAVFLQSRLGPQPGALGAMSAERIAECFKDAERFKRELDSSASQQA